MPHLQGETTPEALGRLAELLQERADQEGRAYLLVTHCRGVEFTSVCPYGVAEADATSADRQGAALRILPQGRAPEGDPS